MARGWKPAQGRLQPGFASVLLVSNSSWRAEAEVSEVAALLWIENARRIMPHLQRIVKAAPVLNVGLMLVMGFLGTAILSEELKYPKYPTSFYCHFNMHYFS